MKLDIEREQDMATELEVNLTPREIVSSLDERIVGQAQAKRAVAIALRNRWRRLKVNDDLRQEITPKNILMIGPTGVGKTEISRRLAELAGAPFIKVEATKFTEVGYVGRDVESIIRDLMDVAIKMTRERLMGKVKTAAEDSAEELVLDILVPAARGEFSDQPDDNAGDDHSKKEVKESATRQLYRKKLREGELDDKEIDVDVAASSNFEIMGPPGMEEMVGQLQNMMETMSNKKTSKRRMKVKDALKQLTEDEADKMLNEEEVRANAIESVEQNGIVFLDEIDKIVRRTDTGGDVSREGVQRDLLPLVEGTTVVTKYGMIKTDHILFIASGAFHLAKPSDLVPELQGRFPIRVELDALKTEDFIRILTEPRASLTEQYVALLETEGFNLTFHEDGVQRIAELAQQVNDKTENIGARRLHTLLEKLLDQIAFSATDRSGESQEITAEYVDQQLTDLAEDEDLSRSIL